MWIENPDWQTELLRDDPYRLRQVRIICDEDCYLKLPGVSVP